MNPRRTMVAFGVCACGIPVAVDLPPGAEMPAAIAHKSPTCVDYESRDGNAYLSWLLEQRAILEAVGGLPAVGDA